MNASYFVAIKYGAVTSLIERSSRSAISRAAPIASRYQRLENPRMPSSVGMTSSLEPSRPVQRYGGSPAASGCEKPFASSARPIWRYSSSAPASTMTVPGGTHRRRGGVRGEQGGGAAPHQYG